MSPENVEIVRAQFRATNEQDFARVTSDWADDIELVVPSDAIPESGVFRGTDAVGQWFANWFGSFERGYRFDIEEARDLGDVVLVVTTHHGRGRASKAEVQATISYLYRVRDGQIIRVEIYRSRKAALEAVELSEQDAHADS